LRIDSLEIFVVTQELKALQEFKIQIRRRKGKQEYFEKTWFVTCMSFWDDGCHDSRSQRDVGKFRESLVVPWQHV
jgi:hypothetical protein